MLRTFLRFGSGDGSGSGDGAVLFPLSEDMVASAHPGLAENQFVRQVFKATTGCQAFEASHSGFTK